MRANEFLTELANAPYPTHMTGVTPPGSSTKTNFYRFTTDAGLDYDIAIQTYKDDSTVSSKPTGEFGIRVDFSLASIDPNDERKWAGTEVEGTGDAMRVFATVRKQVLDSIKDFDRAGAMAFAFMKPDNPDRPAKPRNIKFIQFQAHSKFPSRIKLYNRIAQTASKWFPGFKLTRGPYSIIEHGEVGLRWVLKKQETAQVVDEAPLPPDWDEKQYQPGSSFKARLAYALDRAKKLGAGSSRVAVTIEYQGRPTVLKIAKNTRGLGQNNAEASILNDGYASQMGILIPLIDYDKQNPEPTWIHTELAQRASKKQLCAIMKCDYLGQLVELARAIKGGEGYPPYADFVKSRLTHKTKPDIETMTEYANKLVDLDSQFDVQLGDLTREVNWGIYQGEPVIIDVGYTDNVRKQYYSR
ncbi:MAG: hypothetical protein ACO294_09375 [Methylococcales bacterium]